MRWILPLTLFCTFYCPASFSEPLNSEPLDKARLKYFSEHLQKITTESPKNIYKFLSEKLEVELTLGSNSQGVTFFYNKNDYIKMVNQKSEEIKEQNKGTEFKFSDYIVSSPTKGRFTVSGYFKKIKLMVWTTYFLELEENEIVIIKIVEEI